MKQIVYSCLKCKKQETVPFDKNHSAPLDWAVIYYERVHNAEDDGQMKTLRTTTEAYACDDCAKGVLDFLEPPPQTLLKSA